MTESSESVLAGTKRPPFRLYCNAVVPPGANFQVRPAVSEEFVVGCLKPPCTSATPAATFAALTQPLLEYYVAHTAAVESL